LTLIKDIANETVIYCQKREFTDKQLQNFYNSLQSLNFQPLVLGGGLHRETNVGRLPELLELFECYPTLVLSQSKIPEYGKFVDEVLYFIDQCCPWFTLVFDGDEFKGVAWAHNWTDYSVEIGGVFKRGVNPIFTTVAAYKFCEALFAIDGLEIIRAEFDSKNRAVRYLLHRVGFTSLEERRYVRLINGHPIHGQYLSMTRKEWDDYHGRQIG
jgi:hypothetical protein